MSVNYVIIVNTCTNYSTGTCNNVVELFNTVG